MKQLHAYHHSITISIFTTINGKHELLKMKTHKREYKISTKQRILGNEILGIYYAQHIAKHVTRYISTHLQNTLRYFEPNALINNEWIHNCHLIEYVARASKLCTIGIQLLGDTLIDWVFNGTSTHKGQFVPTLGEGNWLKLLSLTNEIQYIIPYLTYTITM